MLRILQRQVGDIAVVRPHGRMTFHNAGCLLSMVDILLASGARNVVLNLGAVTSDDGSAISASLQSLHRVRASGGHIRVVDPAVASATW
jgi:anti-anti-sigma factor